MDGGRLVSWRNPWFKWSMLALLAAIAVSFGVGFVWLPSAVSDFSVAGAWASICRAAGVPTKWGGNNGIDVTGVASTNVVLDRSMARAGADDAIGRGATLALGCTTCHGKQGMSTSDAPNLAGQYPEVVIKQLGDFRSGRRLSPIMQGLATGLSDADIGDLAAYYGYLPKSRRAPTTYADALPAVVRVGAPLRNIAPCVACHGGIDQKLGAPWLEGMPRPYLVEQMKNFQSGDRHNDSHGQMRNMARAMTGDEIEAVATFYARRASR